MLAMPRPAAQACWRSTRTSSCGTLPSSLERVLATPGISCRTSFTCEAMSLRRVASGPCTLTAIGRAAPAEDRASAADVRGEARESREFLADGFLDLELAARALRLVHETDADIAAGRAPRPPMEKVVKSTSGEGAHVLVDGLRPTHGVRQARARRDAEVDRELAGVGVGHPSEAKPGHDGECHRYRCQGHRPTRASGAPARCATTPDSGRRGSRTSGQT